MGLNCVGALKYGFFSTQNRSKTQYSRDVEPVYRYGGLILVYVGSTRLTAGLSMHRCGYARAVLSLISIEIVSGVVPWFPRSGGSIIWIP